MKIAVAGSRSFHDYAHLCAVLDEHGPTAIISGGANGADTLARQYAHERELPFFEFLPKFKTDKSIPYHPRWYLTRNQDMVNAADMLVAFWDGKSKGTSFTIDYAAKIGKPSHVATT